MSADVFPIKNVDDLIRLPGDFVRIVYNPAVLEERRKWLKEHCSGKIGVTYGTFYFEKQADAVLYKLTFER